MHKILHVAWNVGSRVHRARINSQVLKEHGAQKNVSMPSSICHARRRSDGSESGMKRTIAAKELVTSSGLLEDPLITMDGGRIVRISTRNTEAITQVDHEFPECTLTPGFSDIHFHGAAGHDVTEGRPEALETVARYLARVGVTKFLPTTATASLEATLYALERMATESGLLQTWPRRWAVRPSNTPTRLRKPGSAWPRR
jgi:hypothetical protein